jgi:UDP-N-acetylglucosamine 4,6-dehydratase/5-epimerase
MSKYLITGGPGSLGKEICNSLLSLCDTKEIIMFSRNETKQFEASMSINDKRVRYVVGDIKNYDSLFGIMKGVDYVFHAAALKHIDLAEKSPDETIKVNVLGTSNVINAAIQNNVKKVLLISTDKACIPTSIYGVSKLLSEKNAILSNDISDTKFSVVRFGNLIGSNGSIFQKWKIMKNDSDKISVTHKKMTRFFIRSSEAAFWSIKFMEIMNGKEVFVPKMKSANIYDIAKSFIDESRIDITGTRPGEKLDEDILSNLELGSVEDMGEFYILNNDNASSGFSYNSSNNKQWYSGEEINGFF